MKRPPITVRAAVLILSGLIVAGCGGLLFKGCSGKPRMLEINSLASVPASHYGITLSGDGNSVIISEHNRLLYYGADAKLSLEHDYPVPCCGALQAAGKYVFIFDRTTLLRFNQKEPELIEKVNLPADTDDVFLSPDARFLAAFRRAAGVLEVIDLDSKNIVSSLQHSKSESYPLFRAAFFEDNRFLVSYDNADQRLSVWNVKSGKKVNEAKLYDGCTFMIVAPEGDSLVIYGGKGCYVCSLPDLVKRFGLETDRPAKNACLRDNVLYFALSLGIMQLPSDAGCVCMYDFGTGKYIGGFRADKKRLLNWIGISGDGKYLLTSGGDGLKSWDLGNVLRQIKK
jgi:WD40 repeat protein